LSEPRETPVSQSAVRAAYDAVADAYASAFLGELAGKPLDRGLLDVFADETRSARRPVVDVCTGPGHIARYLHERGVHVRGVDLSPAMVAKATALHPDIDFRVGDIARFDADAGSFSGMTCFYGIVHLVREQLVPVFRELARVLASGASLLLAFHVGEETIALGEFLGERVSLAWNFFSMVEVTDALDRAGFTVEVRLERVPYPFEHPSVRGYVVARRR
jgi:SAM-dependent methyltransferase